MKVAPLSVRMIATGLLGLCLSACASTTPLATPGLEQVFSTPDQAAAAFADANRKGDKQALMTILGPDAKDLISSGDPVADKTWRGKFTAAYDVAHRFQMDGTNQAVLIVGTEEWPLPLPLVQVKGGWQFDTSAGKEEILDRRIGRNELNVIEICRAYVEAQREYADKHLTFHGKRVYAEKFISSKGKHDGLYWVDPSGNDESPFGPLIASAQAEGYLRAGTHGNHAPYHGYYFKILKAQGPNASSGAKDYVVHGHMTEGFAMLAFPSKYGDSGIMTFIVNQHGIVYEKNFGEDTRVLAKQITKFDPDSGWMMP